MGMWPEKITSLTCVVRPVVHVMYGVSGASFESCMVWRARLACMEWEEWYAFQSHPLLKGFGA